MRGGDRQTGWMFSYVSPEDRVPTDHPLRSIRRMTDAILDRLSPRFDRLYSTIGRPSIPPALIRSQKTIEDHQIPMGDVRIS